MKLLFFNVLNGELAKELEEFLWQHADARVIAIQEAEEAAPKICSSIFKNYQLVEASKVQGTERAFQHTYIHPDLEVGKTAAILKDEPDTGLALYTEIKHGQNVFHVANVHGIARPGDKLDNPGRLKQSQGIIDYFKPLSGKKIIAGDFNLEKGTKSIAMFEKSGYRNLIEEYSIPTTRNQINWDRYPGEPRQYFADWAFVSSDVEVNKFEVPDVLASDHLPLILEVE